MKCGFGKTVARGIKTYDKEKSMARKKWKSGMALALSALMVLGAAGCGNANAGQTSQPAQSEAPAEQPAQQDQADAAQEDNAQADSTDLEVVKILGRNYTYTGANGRTVTLKDWSTEGKSKRWAKLEEEMAKKGVKLELDLIEPDQFDTTIQTMAASGELFNYDLINITPLDDKTKQNLVKQGQLQPISDILETYSEGAYKEFAASEAGQFYENRMRLEDGKIYWVTDFETNTYKGEPTAFVLAAHIRQDWLDAVGREVPKTADEFFDTLVEFQEQDVNGNGEKDEGFLVNYGSFGTDIGCWFGLGIDLTFIDSTDNYTVKSPWYQEHVKEYITFMQKLYANGLLKMDDNQSSTYKANNQVAGFASWATELWEEPQITVPEGAAYPWFVPFRAEAVEGQTPLFRGANKYNPGWTATAVPAGSDKQAAIAKIFDFLVTDEAILLQEHGIEGVSYELVDGMPSNIQDSSLENTDAVGMALWANGSIFPRFDMNKEMSVEMANTIAYAENNGVKNNQSGKSDFTLACVNDPEHRIFHDTNGLAVATIDEIDRINEISTDLNTYSSELLTKLIMGEKSLDDWDSYMSDLKDLGLDDLIAIQQARCDRAFK